MADRQKVGRAKARALVLHVDPTDSFAQVVFAGRQVDARRRQPAISQHPLHLAEVCAACQQATRQAVPERAQIFVLSSWYGYDRNH